MTLSRSARYLVYVCFASFSATAFPQGSLTPPAGPPAPTMKRLDQIEARTVIDPSQPGFTLPYTISQPGAYYLAGNVTATGATAGIVIASDDVNLDLNGFALTGIVGATRGIDVPAAHRNLTVKNGTVRGWPGGGVRAENASGSLLEKLCASGNSGGVFSAGLAIGDGSLIKDCVSTGNLSSAAGFKSSTNTTVVNSTASSNAGYGFYLGGTSTITGCTANANSVYGILAATSCTIINCNISNNAGRGISAGDACVVNACAVINNAGGGVSASGSTTVTNCTVNSNTGAGIQVGNGSNVNACTAASNSGRGIFAGDGGSIHHCSARANGLDGILVGSTSYLFGNVCDGNNTSADSLAAGMRCTGDSNRVDSNTCTNNGARGFTFPGVNFVTRNTSRGQTLSYSVGSGAVITNGGSAQADPNVNSWTNWAF